MSKCKIVNVRKIKKRSPIKRKKTKKSVKSGMRKKSLSKRCISNSGETINPTKSVNENIKASIDKKHSKKSIKEKDININITFDLKETKQPRSVGGNELKRDLRCPSNNDVHKKKFKKSCEVSTNKEKELNNKNGLNKKESSSATNAEKSKDNKSVEESRKGSNNLTNKSEKNCLESTEKSTTTKTLNKSGKNTQPNLIRDSIPKTESSKSTLLSSNASHSSKFKTISTGNTTNSDSINILKKNASIKKENSNSSQKKTFESQKNSADVQVKPESSNVNEGNNKVDISKTENHSVNKGESKIKTEISGIQQTSTSDPGISSKPQCTCSQKKDCKTTIEETCKSCKNKCESKNRSNNHQQDKALENTNLFGTPKTKIKKK